MKSTEFDMPGNGVCYWTGETEKEWLLGMVGTGAGFYSIVDIVQNEEFREFLPPMRLIAAAETGTDSPRQALLEKLGVDIYPTFEEMQEAHPDIDLYVELGNKPLRLHEIRQKLPMNVSLMDHRETIFFCGLRDMARIRAFQESNLNQQRNLLQAIFDEVREDMMVLDRDGRIVDLNRNVWSRAGAAKEELIGRHCWEILKMEGGTHLCSGPDTNCAFFETLKTGKTAEAMLTRVDGEGQLRYFRVYSYPIFNQHGDLSNIMIMHRDITTRTYKERHQHQRDKLAVIGEMSTYLAHEIRNPLFALGGFAHSLLRSTNLDQKEREKVEIIAQETKRLDHMLSSMLSFVKPARAVAGQVDLCRLVEETVELMNIGYGKQGYEFVLKCDVTTPKVRGDVEMVKQCLLNLIKNSIEAMPDGGPITVSSGIDGEYVYLTVEDSGSGMSEKDLEKVFSPFYTTKEKGCGLGLAMIKKIVEDYGGEISIKSRLDKGTVVSMRLPPVLAVDPELRSAQEIAETDEAD